MPLACIPTTLASLPVDRQPPRKRCARRLTRIQPPGPLARSASTYHYDFSPRAAQREVFRCQIGLARELGWPVVIHTREAETDTFEILRDEGEGQLSGIFHCFTGNVEMARGALELGFHVSFAGIVTFPRATELREAAKVVPADRLLVETDCPYLAPVPHRGKRNEPAWVTHVLDTLADVRGQAAESVAADTGHTVCDTDPSLSRINLFPVKGLAR